MQPFVQEAHTTFSMVQTGCGDAGGQEPGRDHDVQPEPASKSDFEDEIVYVLGKRLYETMVLSIVALLKACEQTNSWITITDGAAVTWLLVQDALSRCDAMPVILLVRPYR